MKRAKNNLLLITTDYPPQKGGIASWAYEEYKKLNKIYNVIVIDKAKPDYKKKSDVAYFRNNKDLKNITKKTCKEKKVKEVIFFHWETARPLYLWLKLNRIPYTIALHGWEFLRPRSLYVKFIKKLILKHSKEIWVLSPYLKNKVLEYNINEAKIKIVPLPISQSKFKQLPKNKRNMLKRKYVFLIKKTIFSVASLIEKKDFFTALKSIKILKNRYPEILYIIVGDGPIMDKLLRFITDNKLKENVLLFGEVSDKKLIELYNISDLFILTPKEIKEQGDIEGFGIVYHEARLCGLPVIGSNTGGVKYSLSLIDNSYIINKGDFRQLAKLIRKIIF